MFDWVRHKDAMYKNTVITCREDYVVCKGKDTKGVDTYTAWPPSLPRPPASGIYNWKDYTLHSIGIYYIASEAKQACWDHYQEKLNARAVRTPS